MFKMKNTAPIVHSVGSQFQAMKTVHLCQVIAYDLTINE